MFASFVLGRTLAHRRAANHDFASYFLNRRPPAHVSGEFLGLCSFREREREREREGGAGRERRLDTRYVFRSTYDSSNKLR